MVGIDPRLIQNLTWRDVRRWIKLGSIYTEMVGIDPKVGSFGSL